MNVCRPIFHIVPIFKTSLATSGQLYKFWLKAFLSPFATISGRSRHDWYGHCSVVIAYFAIVDELCDVEVTVDDVCGRAFANGHCDSSCDTEVAHFDGFDCVVDPNPTTTTTTLNSYSRSSRRPAQCPVDVNSSSSSVSVDQLSMETKCRRSFADGVCDSDCDNAACLWDGGDCISTALRSPLLFSEWCVLSVNYHLLLVFRTSLHQKSTHCWFEASQQCVYFSFLHRSSERPWFASKIRTRVDSRYDSIFGSPWQTRMVGFRQQMLQIQHNLLFEIGHCILRQRRRLVYSYDIGVCKRCALHHNGAR